MKYPIFLLTVVSLQGCIVQPLPPPYYGYGDYYHYQRPPYYPHERYRPDQDDGLQGMHTPEEYGQPTDLGSPHVDQPGPKQEFAPSQEQSPLQEPNNP